MSYRENKQQKELFYKKFNMIFMMGILLSLLSGIGSILPFVSDSIIVSSGIMGMVFVGVGYAGKRHFSK